MPIECLFAWVALSVCVALFGRLIDNETVMGVGAVMLVLTCAFKC